MPVRPLHARARRVAAGEADGEHDDRRETEADEGAEDEAEARSVRRLDALAGRLVVALGGGLLAVVRADGEDQVVARARALAQVVALLAAAVGGRLARGGGRGDQITGHVASSSRSMVGFSRPAESSSATTSSP